MWVEDAAPETPQEHFSVGVHPREVQEVTPQCFLVWKGSDKQGKDKHPGKGCSRAWCIKQRELPQLPFLKSTIPVIPSRNQMTAGSQRLPSSTQSKARAETAFLSLSWSPGGTYAAGRRCRCVWTVKSIFSQQTVLTLSNIPHFPLKLWLLHMGRMFILTNSRKLFSPPETKGGKTLKIKPSLSVKRCHIAEL